MWADGKAAQEAVHGLRRLKTPIEELAALEHSAEDVGVLLELAEETADADVAQEATNLIGELEQRMERLDLSVLLSGPYDSHDAILSIHGGAGGVDAMDWAQMLYRMYTRFCERQGYQVEVLDFLPGEEAGVKGVTFQISGHMGYGFLKAERGVHRLVRMSPFDSSGRRHTSFASLDVLPVIESEDEVPLTPEELRIDTYRSSGAGGQHVNKTESAVRITHLATGIVVSCQNERSQHANRETAMRILRAKLLEKKELDQQHEMAQLRGIQQDISWGSQIRSYVFQPFTMVKDHRTGHETGDVQAVMDGELSPFIRAYLEFEAKRLSASELDSAPQA